MWNFAFWSFSTAEHLLHHSRPQHSYTPLDAFKPHKHTYTLPKCSQTPPSGISGHFRTTTDTNRHQTTPTDVAKHPKRLFKDVWQFMLTSIFVCWCLMTSFTVLCCLQMSEGCLRSFSRGIWVLLIDLFKVWMRIRVYGSAQALYCVANTLYWKSFKRQIFTHLTVLKHQNTKTSLYELSKNHWVFALFEIFGLVRKILQSTVFNDHPVSTM